MDWHMAVGEVQLLDVMKIVEALRRQLALLDMQSADLSCEVGHIQSRCGIGSFFHYQGAEIG